MSTQDQMGNEIDDPAVAQAATQGAIPDDNSGAAPVMSNPANDDNSGAAPVMPMADQPQPVTQDQMGNEIPGIQPRGVPQPDTSGAGQPEPGAPGAKGYVTGEGAAAPTDANKFAYHEKTNGRNDSDANLLAVQHANSVGGPAAAWAMVQYNRVAYNASAAFAKSALNGVDGKAGDINAAALAANKAGAHILDGSSVQYRAEPGGVVASIQMPGTTQRQEVKLTPEQFNQALDIGKDGLWDKVMQTGIPAALAAVAKQPGEPLTGPQQGAAPKTDLHGQPIAAGAKDEYGRPVEGYNEPADNSLEGRSNQIFGRGNVGTNPDRLKWLQGQEDEEAKLKNPRDIADINAKAHMDVQNTRSVGANTVQETKNEGAAAITDKKVAGAQGVEDSRAKGRTEKTVATAKAAQEKMDRNTSDMREKQAGANGRAELTNPNAILQKEGDADAIFKKHSVPSQSGTALGAATAPQAQAPAKGLATAASGQTVTVGGKSYTRDQFVKAYPNGVPGQ